MLIYLLQLLSSRLYLRREGWLLIISSFTRQTRYATLVQVFHQKFSNFGQTYFTRQTRYATSFFLTDQVGILDRHISADRPGICTFIFYSQTRYTSFSFTARPIVHRENRFLRFSQIDQTSFFSIEFHQTHQSKTLHQRSQDQNKTNVFVQMFWMLPKKSAWRKFKYFPCEEDWW